jgi:ribonuclease HI
MTMSKLTEIFIDGASRGNPGPSGIGMVFFDENKNIVKKMFKFIGNATNNIAEYSALIYALQEAIMDRRGDIVVNSDSELLTRQLRGEYKVKNENLKYFYEQFLHLSRGFNSIKIVTIRREENAAADKLANKAIDSRLDNSLKIE